MARRNRNITAPITPAVFIEARIPRAARGALNPASRVAVLRSEIKCDFIVASCKRIVRISHSAMHDLGGFHLCADGSREILRDGNGEGMPFLRFFAIATQFLLLFTGRARKSAPHRLTEPAFGP